MDHNNSPLSPYQFLNATIIHIEQNNTRMSLTKKSSILFLPKQSNSQAFTSKTEDVDTGLHVNKIML